MSKVKRKQRSLSQIIFSLKNIFHNIPKYSKLFIIDSVELIRSSTETTSLKPKFHSYQDEHFNEQHAG